MNNERTTKLKINTITSLILQVITIVSGLILPRLILEAYGSDINGLINSITQFLSIISLLELGLGAVVQSALYKPIANKDLLQINRILTSANKFFRKLAYFLIGYVLVLFVTYPLLVNQNFSAAFSVSLIIIISINSFTQYFFGIVDSLFLLADQRGYFYYSIQIITLILNTFFSVFLINIGCSIHVIKIASSAIFLLRPIVVRMYINKRYHINRKEKYNIEPIDQKWNGIAQHIAAIILDSTDMMVLTVFSSIGYVSVYSVYNMVITGVRQLVSASCNGVTSFWGMLLAMRKKEELRDSFVWTEWLMHTITTLIFGCTAVLILPFIKIYTNGISDIDYCQPIFALLITIAGALRCIRLPYNSLILSAGHYRQTQSNYIIAAIINILTSVLLVIYFGLVGVAVGTLVAMLYQTVWMAIYVSKKLIIYPLKFFIKQFLVDIIIFFVGYIMSNYMPFKSISYISWIVMSVKVFVSWILVSLLINSLFYPKMLKKIFKLILPTFYSRNN